MPLDITDVDEFTSPVTRPAGSDARTADVWGEGHQKLANRTRFLLEHALGGDTTWPNTRVVCIAGSRMRGVSSEWASDAIGSAQTNTNAALGAIELDPELVTGAILSGVVVRGVCTTASVHGFRFKLFKRQLSTGTLTQIGSTADSGASSGAYTTSVTAASEVIDRGDYIYFLKCESSSTASTGDGDYVHFLNLVFSDPGPRNY